MRQISFLTVAVLGLLAAGTPSVAAITSWDASQGLLPNSPSIPLDARFDVYGDPSFLSLGSNALNFSDTVFGANVGFRKDDIDPSAFDGDWAYQAELQINSHNRPQFEWGATLGIRDGVKRATLVVANGAIGLAGDLNTDSFANGLFVPMDTTDGFHVYRVTKSNGIVSVFVDTFESAVLSVPYNDLPTFGATQVTLAWTTSFGTTDFELGNFAYNLDGTDIPEPSTGLLLGVASIVALRRRRE